jgi:hypothetical protein
MTFGFGRGADAQCLATYYDQCGQRPGVVGGRPVVGDLAQAVRSSLGHTTGQLGVDPRPLSWDELVVEDLAGQFVPEAHLVTLGDQQTAGEQDLQRHAQGVNLNRADIGKHIGRGRAGRGRHTEHVARDVIQPDGSGTDHFAERVGNALPSRGVGDDQLLDEERVAATSAMHVSHVV